MYDPTEDYGVEVAAAIKAEAAAAFPKEAIGVVIKTPTGEKRCVVCTNRHAKPTRKFQYDDTEWDTAQTQGEIILTWHSHPNGKPEPSDDDRTYSESSELAMLIYATPADFWTLYRPSGWMAPLTGRMFSYGILDCFTLVRDYYKTTLNIDIPFFETEDGWWWHKRDEKGALISQAPELYLENFEKAGFRKVPELQVHDVILMRVIEGALSHVGVWLGDGHMLHHYYNRPSGIIAYQPGIGFYGKATELFVRHETLC